MTSPTFTRRIGVKAAVQEPSPVPADALAADAEFDGVAEPAEIEFEEFEAEDYQRRAARSDWDDPFGTRVPDLPVYIPHPKMTREELDAFLEEHGDELPDFLRSDPANDAAWTPKSRKRA